MPRIPEYVNEGPPEQDPKSPRNRLPDRHSGNSRRFSAANGSGREAGDFFREEMERENDDRNQVYAIAPSTEQGRNYYKEETLKQASDAIDEQSAADRKRLRLTLKENKRLRRELEQTKEQLSKFKSSSAAVSTEETTVREDLPTVQPQRDEREEELPILQAAPVQRDETIPLLSAAEESSNKEDSIPILKPAGDDDVPLLKPLSEREIRDIDYAKRTKNDYVSEEQAIIVENIQRAEKTRFFRGTNGALQNEFSRFGLESLAEDARILAKAGQESVAKLLRSAGKKNGLLHLQEQLKVITLGIDGVERARRRGKLDLNIKQYEKVIQSLSQRRDSLQKTINDYKNNPELQSIADAQQELRNLLLTKSLQGTSLLTTIDRQIYDAAAGHPAVLHSVIRKQLSKSSATRAKELLERITPSLFGGQHSRLIAEHFASRALEVQELNQKPIENRLEYLRTKAPLGQKLCVHADDGSKTLFYLEKNETPDDQTIHCVSSDLRTSAYIRSNTIQIVRSGEEGFHEASRTSNISPRMKIRAPSPEARLSPLAINIRSERI